MLTATFRTKIKRITYVAMCDSCEQIRINGVICHERGCPDAWKDETRECRWCGSDFRPDNRYERYCSPCCAAAYENRPCECESCQRSAAMTDDES